ncbi:MAG: hypothetical protein AMJ88_19255 [Anaerolineae bacterium SM23_ 63]|nr:MAG: hypothetical protein AMJ88_19255 [Anaerolineae bacterium SM23_ 63]
MGWDLAYHAISINELFFPSDPSVSLPRAWIEVGVADPARAVMILFFYGSVLVLISILFFQRQDLTTKA